MNSILELVERLFPYAYSVVGAGNDAAIHAFSQELPFTIHEYPSGAELNGWHVPNDWSFTRAELRHKGQLIYDGCASPLGVPVLSPSVKRSLSLDELRPHLFFSEEQPDGIPYHWTNLYRTGERAWGLCMPKRVVDTLTPGEYDVEIITETKPGTMKVLDYVLPGDSDQTILLNAHNCHPFQANDDISGCAIGIAAIKELMRRPNRRYSYRLVIAPELIGTVHWLAGLPDAETSRFKAAVMLKSLGNESDLKLQQSFTGKHLIDRAAHHIYRQKFNTYKSAAFRALYGNDETVFEAPGFEIPSISMTRFPFPTYHTNMDTPQALSPAALDESLDTLLGIIDVLEWNDRFKANFKGLVALSSPKYDLYLAASAPGIDREAYDAQMGQWNLLMNCLPRHLDGETDLLAIAERYDLPFGDVRDYVEKWVSKGLAIRVEA